MNCWVIRTKICLTLNCIEYFLALVFAVAICISISPFASLIDIYKGIMSSAIGLNIWAIIARINRYKSIIKKKKKNHSKIAFLAITNLDCIKDLISMSLTDSIIECDYFHLIDVLRKFDYMKEKINKLETS